MLWYGHINVLRLPFFANSTVKSSNESTKKNTEYKKKQ